MNSKLIFGLGALTGAGLTIVGCYIYKSVKSVFEKEAKAAAEVVAYEKAAEAAKKAAEAAMKSTDEMLKREPIITPEDIAKVGEKMSDFVNDFAKNGILDKEQVEKLKEKFTAATEQAAEFFRATTNPNEGGNK
jgi:hypothetical protein